MSLTQTFEKTYDRQIKILQSANTQDALGEVSRTDWTTFATVFAHKSPRPGFEFFQSGRVIDETKVFFTIRHRTGVTTAMRVQELDGGLFEIRDVMYSEDRNSTIQLECKKVN